MSATFKVTSGSAAFNGDLVGNASWTSRAARRNPRQRPKRCGTSARSRSTSSYRHGCNSTDSFIELYNAGDSDVDISNWTLTEHPTQQAIFSSVKIPAGTKLAAKGFYLLGLANSGLAVPAQKGDTTIYVRSTTGMNVGDTIEIDTGSGVETRKIASVGTAAGNSTTLWQPLPDGPVITIPAGSTNVPYTGGGGLAAGRLRGRGRPEDRHSAMAPPILPSRTAVEKYEVVTVTAVGKPGTQTYLAADAKAGDTTIRVRNAGNISVGDKIRSGYRQRRPRDRDRHGHERRHAGGGRRRAWRRRRRGLELAAPLKFNHAANMPFSVRGTGISFQPATAFAHSSNEPLQPLGTGITLDSPWPTTTRSTRSCVTPQSRPRATKGRRRPTSGSAARPSPTPATWCCVTPPAWSWTASTTAAWLIPGPPKAIKARPAREAAAACLRPPGAEVAAAGAQAADGARAQQERGPHRGRRRHRQQLRRFPGAGRHARCAQPETSVRTPAELNRRQRLESSRTTVKAPRLDRIEMPRSFPFPRKVTLKRIELWFLTKK